MFFAPIVKLVRAFDSVEWEIFISEWQKGLKGYHAVKRLGNAGDHGRDVIGLCSPRACEGVWDNYQCKHYDAPLAASKACEDAGKIIFHAFQEVFTPPRRCVFVAPRGVTTELRDMLLNPAKFRAEVIKTWGTRVASKIEAGKKHILVDALDSYVQAYDFTSFDWATMDEILDAHRQTAYWAARFNGQLPPPNLGVTPATIASGETVYVGKLLDVYAEAAGAPITCVDDLDSHGIWKNDLQRQRVKYFDAEAFMATYRDQTEPGTTEGFASQILEAIEPSLTIPGSGLNRLTTALTIAGNTAPASVLTPQAKIGVRQGVCHQLANDGDRVIWKV